MGSFKKERDLYVLQLFYHLIHPFMMRNNWSTEPKISKNVMKCFTLVIAINTFDLFSFNLLQVALTSD